MIYWIEIENNCKKFLQISTILTKIQTIKLVTLLYHYLKKITLEETKINYWASL